MKAIEFINVGKQYRLGLVGTGSLQHDINRWWQTSILGKEDPYLKIGEVNDRTTKGNSDYVWALKDINFSVEEGDVVGIIGKNGAGKSTLLKLLSHITSPSTGTIRYKGRIASLLEVGTGFHPELTARENIYMNGSIMGMTKHEIDRKLDEIIDFAGVERYLDTPVKRFSSGMTVRLGFAVAAFLEPEILVVDEVLAVGDAEFQKKAIGKMKEVSQGGGRTVLFVSHNMTSLRALCNHGVLLENGLVRYSGTINDVVTEYLSTDFDITKRYGNGKVRVEDYRIAKEYVNLGDDIEIYLSIRINQEIEQLDINIILYNLLGERIVECSYTDDNMFSLGKLEVGHLYKLKCTIKNVNCLPGQYKINIWVANGGEAYDWLERCMGVTVFQNGTFINRNKSYTNVAKLVLASKWEML